MSDTNGIKTQVDYILIRKKWKNIVKNCKAYSNFSSIGSDHRIITVNIRLSLRSNVKQKKRINYDWSILRDPKICKEYSKQVKHTYNELKAISTEISTTATYDHFIKANEETAKLLIQKKRKPRDKIIAQDNKIQILRNSAQTAYNVYSALKTINSHEKLTQAKQSLQDEYDKIVAEILERNAESWKLINKITGRKNSKRGKIKANKRRTRN